MARTQRWPSGSIGSPQNGQSGRPAPTTDNARSTNARAAAAVTRTRKISSGSGSSRSSRSSWSCSGETTAASVSVVRYTESRPFVLGTNTHAGDLAWLTPPRKPRRTTRSRRADAEVGGGAGPQTGTP